MKKTLFKTLFTSAIALSSVVAPVLTLAQDYDALIGETQATIDNLTAEQANLYAQLTASYVELEAIQSQANALLLEIAADDALIGDLQEQIKELETLISKREVLLAEQARAVQVNGGSTNYVSLVASSKSVTDFVGRLDVVRKMVDANKELIVNQKEDKEAVEAKKSETEETKQDKVSKMVELETLKATIAEQSAQAEAVYNQLTADISLAASHRDALVAEKAAFEYAQAVAQAQALAQAQAIAEANAQLATPAVVESEESVEAVPSEENAETVAVASVVESLPKEAPVAELPVAEVPTESVVAEEVQPEVVATPEEVQPTAVTAETVLEATTAVETPEVQPVAEVTEAPVATPAPSVAEETAPAEETATSVEVEAVQVTPTEEVVEEAPAVVGAEPVVETPAPAPSSDLLSIAAQYLGTPYVWGGKSPSGFDCSGFVQYVFKQAYGKDIGGWTVAQESSGTKISVAEAQPGDLYFWGSPGGTYHVAIATGGGNFIHASQPGTPLEYNHIQNFTPQFALRVH